MSVTITSPQAGATLTGTVTITATYVGTGFNLATLIVDGVQVGAADTAQPIQFQLDTTHLTEGSHTLAVSVKHKQGKQYRWDHSPNVSVTVKNTVTPPPSKALWGARIDSDVYGTSDDAPWDSTTWDTFESHAGAKVQLLHFGQPNPWKQSFAKTPFDLTIARGAVPVCTMSTDDAKLSDIAAGVYDTSIRAWAASAAAWRGQILLRWNWEMNGSWYAWGAAQPAADYVAAWRHWHDLMPANVEMVWCPNVIYNGAQPLLDRFPGDNYISHLGMDGYNWGTNPLKPDVWRSFEQTFQPTYDALVIASTRPILICEVASTEYGGDKAAWITGMFNTLPALGRVEGFCWFNWNVIQGAGRMDWPIESSASATAAFRAGV